MLETRTFPRADVASFATFEWGDDNRISATVINVSEGGLLARTATPLDVAQRVRVLLPVPASDAPLDLNGSVVRSEQLDAGFRVALEWTHLSRSAVSEIRRLVESTEAMAWESSERTLPRALAVRFVPKIRRLAWTIAKRVRMPAHLCVDDLVGAGFIALIELHTRYPEADFDELERIGSARLRGAMLDELRAADPLSRRMRQRQRRIDRAQTALNGELGRAPTDAELRARAGLKPKAFAEAVLAGGASVRSIHDEGDGPEIVDMTAMEPDVLVSRQQELQRIRCALDVLPPRLKHVLELYYGDDLTLREIGNLLGVSEARISQLLASAVRKLRESCADAPTRTKPQLDQLSP
ncbi:MAG: sigma-70 family RNA polymerase sigma factor [Polyangiaceae bacterium]|nr:sigma-70 family RNA polymerase sigma factor [Polyangiaceae bacterium]